MLKWLRKERRETYRVEPTSGSPLEVRLILSDREITSSAVSDVSAQGANVVFPLSECPAFSQDQKVRLKIRLGPTSKTHTVDALVKGSHVFSDKRRCRFQFLDPGKSMRGLEPELHRYLNRRQTNRVRPDSTAPVEVTLEWRDGLSQGQMFDISVKGMALHIGRDVAQELGHPDRLLLSFRLPGHKRLFNLVGQSFFRRSEESGRVRYGIQFDWGQTEEAEQQGKAIAEYVQQRQKAAARAAN
jgi:c-di-GMP-binding flagellar brake protein YcgR